MNFWKYRVFNKNGYLLHQDFGFETEEDAEKEAIAWANAYANKDWIIGTYQTWQELEYEVPTQVLFFDPELQEVHAGIAYMQDVICGECGGIFALDEVEILKENTDEWRDIEPALAGDTDYHDLQTYNAYSNDKTCGIPQNQML